MKPFDVDGQTFVLNGTPTRLLAGAMHYFRVPREVWEDRMIKIKALGLNTLETYVCWNLHEPKPGMFVFEGMLDIVEYIRLAERVGLKVIVRPGPYICSEWDMGGLPAWLLKDPAMQVRCCYPPYLEAVDRFFNKLLSMLKPLQISEGGPIIAMQVENEYGSFGNEKAYLRHVEKLFQANGIETFLFTCDNRGGLKKGGGDLPHLLQTANFGSNPGGAFELLRKRQPDGPLVCMEFWNGWFDAWGDEHHTREPEAVAASLDEILAMGGSFCLYMVHGGTNFGFMSGANGNDEKYRPTITSYDSNAPIGEHGNLTPKYYAIREIIGKYVHLPDAPSFPPSTTTGFGEVKLTEATTLRSSVEVLSTSVRSLTPLPMEMLDQNHGFILYRTRINGPSGKDPLVLHEVRDRAHVFLNGNQIGCLERERLSDEPIQPDVPDEGADLEILVENMGRVNYGPGILDRKGITDHVRIGDQLLFDWEIYPLPLSDLSGLHFSACPAGIREPTFFRGSLSVDKTADTFLKLEGWTKGVAWINDHNLGSYWNRGPQQTLYVPWPWLREGANELIVLELDQVKHPTVYFVDEPILDVNDS